MLCKSEWLIFTQPILTDENILITREEHPFIADLAGLQNHIMALPKGTSMEERIRREFPNIHITTTDTEDVGQLAAWAKETAALLSSDHSIALHLEPDLPPLLGDQVLLRILLMNLLSNSLKYAAPNTPVLLRVERCGEVCRLVVEDQGPGIAADELGPIFEKYQRGRLAQDKPGAGLGLALVRRIAALHSGTVSVQSQPGQGSRFTIEVPFHS